MNLRSTQSFFALALALASTLTLTACGAASDVDARSPERDTVARHIETTDCSGEHRVVERLGLRFESDAWYHDLTVDGVPYTLVTATPDGLQQLEVLRDGQTLALAELSGEDARILAPGGEVFISEGGAGFPEALHDAVSAEATLLMSADVVTALRDVSTDLPGVEVRQQGLDNGNTGTCSGVTCASRDTNESCCCKVKCVRDETTCYCTTGTQNLIRGTVTLGGTLTVAP